MLYVVDAGVAAKWFLPEAGSASARQLLERYNLRLDDLIAPDLIVAEVANVLWKRALRGDITSEQASSSLEYFLGLSIPLTPASEVVSSALELALTHQRTAYDSLYLALALDHSCSFITADERLFHALQSSFPQILLLRDWQPPVG